MLAFSLKFRLLLTNFIDSLTLHYSKRLPFLEAPLLLIMLIVFFMQRNLKSELKVSELHTFQMLEMLSVDFLILSRRYMRRFSVIR